MSATFETLFRVKRVVDHDCENYRVGEIDFSYSDAEVDEYLNRFGLQGKQALVSTLGFLIYVVEHKYRTMMGARDKADIKSGKKAVPEEGTRDLLLEEQKRMKSLMEDLSKQTSLPMVNSL